MTDTPDFIRKKQIEIFLSKTEIERWRLGLGMIDEVWYSVKNSIRLENPAISESALIGELFKRYYKNDFSLSTLNMISEKIVLYHQKIIQS